MAVMLMVWTQGDLSSRADWMRRHRLRTLRNICLPGSHQSATYVAELTERRLPLAVGWTRCQRHDIAEQLDAGIRFLDVSVTSPDQDGDGEVKLSSETTYLLLPRPSVVV